MNKTKAAIKDSLNTIAYEYRFCGRKNKYKNKNVAKNVAGQQSAKDNKIIRVYKCPLHNHYHIGKSRYETNS